MEIEDLIKDADIEQIEKEYYPVVPLRGALVFPLMEAHLDIGRVETKNAIQYGWDHDSVVILAIQRDGALQEPKAEDLYEFAVIAKIKKIIPLPTDGIRVIVTGLEKVRLYDYRLSSKAMYIGRAEKIEQIDVVESLNYEAKNKILMQAFESYCKRIGKVSPDTLQKIGATESLHAKLDLICGYLQLPFVERYELLACSTAEEKMDLMIEQLIREAKLGELEKKITDQVKAQIDKTQKEYYLREKIKVISEELGEGEDRAAEIQDFKQRVAKSTLPENVEKKLLKEINRLAKITAMSPEYSVIRNYLDWVLDLPWSKYSEEQIDIVVAEQVLDTDHYGLEKVKERMIEFLAVRQLKQDSNGTIICLVGPPGVGKTSLARSIAKALNREFVRLSLGGVRDEAEIRGHRRTYVGAMPGRIIRGLCDASTANPVFLFDEIDKMSSDFRGDPASALLEVLDPAQNNSFSDHFIEMPFDLSRVMFITTANSVHSIPAPLLDRMEVIELSSYTEAEKVEIALRYLVPKQVKEHGLTEEQLQLSANTILEIIRYHTREAGVRNLERQIGSLCRKTAKEILIQNKKSVKITKQNINKYLGNPKYRYGQQRESNSVGVVTGMAWTAVGGEVLEVEVNTAKGKGNLQLTGKLGDVMKESAQLGLSYIRSISETLQLEGDFYEKIDIHIHVPEGATPKDGPSAGITMTTAMISALTNRSVDRQVAMTGEMTLRGKVLPIGGVKEKVLAAHRAGYRIIILPKDNQRDIDDIPVNVQKVLAFHLVDHIDQVLKIALVGE